MEESLFNSNTVRWRCDSPLFCRRIPPDLPGEWEKKKREERKTKEGEMMEEGK